MQSARTALVWAGLGTAMAVPVAMAAMSPLLQWRDPIYIAAGFAGIIGLSLMLLQPCLISGNLPGFSAYRARRLHRWIGASLVISVVLHVLGLWITSAPDVIDALTFRSPTPFSAWGVIAMWALFASALLVVFRRRLHLRPRTWRISHTFLAVMIVLGTLVHAILIEGTMETVTKIAYCALVFLATAKVLLDLQAKRKRASSR